MARVTTATVVQVVVKNAGPDDFVFEIPHDFANPQAAIELGQQLVKYGSSQAEVRDAMASGEPVVAGTSGRVAPKPRKR